ncbi:hypothetical protein DdX_00704 [Ditylenchus destructor]|uniref:Uncharacterized protein n=1 Tax=Ditylenchus destructor TaxID=166010 RepID=A0AAD4NKH3_9BILA|nr:hypothetical protein DdX_00704 [Ditylenchus destructor]
METSSALAVLEDFKGKLIATIGTEGNEGMLLSRLPQMFKSDWTDPISKYVDFFKHEDLLSLLQEIDDNVKVENVNGMEYRVIPVNAAKQNKVLDIIDKTNKIIENKRSKRKRIIPNFASNVRQTAIRNSNFAAQPFSRQSCRQFSRSFPSTSNRCSRLPAGLGERKIVERSALQPNSFPNSQTKQNGQYFGYRTWKSKAMGNTASLPLSQRKVQGFVNRIPVMQRKAANFIPITQDTMLQPASVISKATPQNTLTQFDKKPCAAKFNRPKPLSQSSQGNVNYQKQKNGPMNKVQDPKRRVDEETGNALSQEKALTAVLFTPTRNLPFTVTASILQTPRSQLPEEAHNAITRAPLVNSLSDRPSMCETFQQPIQEKELLQQERKQNIMIIDGAARLFKQSINSLGNQDTQNIELAQNAPAARKEDPVSQFSEHLRMLERTTAIQNPETNGHHNHQTSSQIVVSSTSYDKFDCHQNSKEETDSETFPVEVVNCEPFVSQSRKNALTNRKNLGEVNACIARLVKSESVEPSIFNAACFVEGMSENLLHIIARLAHTKKGLKKLTRELIN